MHKKLDARTQKLSKQLPQNANDFSTTVNIEPDELELVEKKGNIYAVFDFSSTVSIDPLLVTKIVHDVLHDSYYASETTSPIQSLERALLDVKEKVTNLPEVSAGGTASTEFNILAAALWGNVLYMVQLGKGGSFLVRENVVKPVSSATEGSFSVASGVVKTEDVIVLGTQSFIDKYSAEELIQGKISVSMHDLPATASALLLKFDLIAELTDSERIDFGLEDKPRSQKPPKSSVVLAKKFPSTLPKIQLEKVKNAKSFVPYIFGGIVLIALAASISSTIKGKSISEETSIEEPSAEFSVEETAPEEVVPESQILTTDPEIFYDLKLIDEAINPTSIAVLDSEVLVADSSSGKLFVSSTTTPKFTEEGIFSGIKNLGYFGGDLTFVEEIGFKVYTKPPGYKGKFVESYHGEIDFPIATYLAFLYGVNSSEITKYSLSDEGIEGSTWASGDFSDAVSIAVDGSVYVLGPDYIYKYFGGQREDFEVDLGGMSLDNAIKIVKDINLENIYIADAGNNRVVVLSEEGELVDQYIFDREKVSEITDISVSPQEDKLFVLSGSKVFEVSL